MAKVYLAGGWEKDKGNGRVANKGIEPFYPVSKTGTLADMLIGNKVVKVGNDPTSPDFQSGANPFQLLHH